MVWGFIGGVVLGAIAKELAGLIFAVMYSRKREEWEKWEDQD